MSRILHVVRIMQVIIRITSNTKQIIIIKSKMSKSWNNLLTIVSFEDHNKIDKII